jgi:hypothetical protein
MSFKTKNIQYIDKERIFNKYELTPIIESTDILDDYHRSTLKNYEPDAPTFAYEEKRKNTGSKEKINSRIYGRRAPAEPFVADLFLGDTTPDPRSISYQPNMTKYTSQIWHRKDDYKKSFKNDADNSIHEAGISEGQMNANKKSSYGSFKQRYKNFEESTDAWAPSVVVNNSNKSKVQNNELDGLLVDMQDNENLKYKRDYVNELSLKSLPKGWDSVPDHKIKIANYSMLLKSKNLNNIDIIKNKNRQEVDGKAPDTPDVESKLASQLSLISSNFISKKKEGFAAGKDTKFTNSSETQIRSINDAKEYFKNQDLNNIEITHKTQQISDTFTKNYSSTSNIPTDIRKNVSEFVVNKNINKGNNKESNNFSNKAKKDIITDALRNSLMTNNESFINKGNNKTLFNNNLRNSSNDKRNSRFVMAGSEINKDILNKTGNFEVFNYKSSINKSDFDNFSNMKTGIDSTIVLLDNEKELVQRNLGNQNVESLTTGSFATDTDFNSSNANFAATGSVGIMGNKYQTRHKEYETSIYTNTANDSTSFNKTKYIK